MGDKLKLIKAYLKCAWEDSPWIRAAGVLGGAVAGLAFLNINLPSELMIDLKDSNIGQLIMTGLLLIYFFLAAVFSGDRLRFEKKLRALEQNFKYDNRGTLYNGSEPNIAFRIATFKGMLNGISSAMGVDELANVLIGIGRKASLDFADRLAQIYNSDIAMRKSSTTWDELTFSQKLNQWAEYDSSTGWGILACEIKNDQVKVVVNHLQGLVEGEDGLLFSNFLAGYSETIIGKIISMHDGGKYDEHTSATLLNALQSDRYTVVLEYKLV